jgi:hypothetical protein
LNAGQIIRREKTVCEQKKECEKPDNLKGDPRECSPEQIDKCHGDVKGHPCVPKDEDVKE